LTNSNYKTTGFVGVGVFGGLVGGAIVAVASAAAGPGNSKTLYLFKIDYQKGT
jgi:hypothetical protein